jgi:formamidopyrimidine-DNA glycosylase
VGEGDPYEEIENLGSLGPDVLPYPDASGALGTFDKKEFRRRLLLPEHLQTTIGAALLNQQILAGLGNYLRAEVLFVCAVNPWRKVGELNKRELNCISRMAPELASRAYVFNATATEADHTRMMTNPSLVYQPGREYGTRHLVFRRTNLPCLRCGEAIKQLRQVTHNSGDGEEERTRIVYFCPKCQGVH